MHDDAALSTPFERWCEAFGIHPDDPDAWDFYTWETVLPAS